MKKLLWTSIVVFLAGCGLQSPINNSAPISTNQENNISQENNIPNEPIITNPQKKGKVCIKNYCFDVDIAQTPQEREYGLMNRTSLPQLSGMLFTFEQEGIYTFWMKDTLIPLDMIWINSGLEITYIAEADPCTDDPCPVFNKEKTASYVLEINKWLSKKLWFREWYKVEIQQ